MTTTHNRNHVVRAALEASAYQARDLLDAMYTDSGVELKELRVDGGGRYVLLLFCIVYIYMYI